MATILDIDPLEYGDTSLVKIETNFQNLNTDKAETSIVNTELNKKLNNKANGGAFLEGVVAGAGTTIDNTDPYNPIIGVTPGIGLGDVTLNGAQTLTNKTIDADNNTITNIGTDELSDDGVTFAKMQNITTNKLIGRHSAGNGDPEEVGIGNNLEISGSNLQAKTGITAGTVLEGSKDSEYAKLASANVFTESQTITGATSSVAGLKIRATNIGTNQFLEFQNDGGNKRMGIIYDNSVPGFGIQNRSGGDLLRVVESNGNVGIGTTSPEAKSHVRTSTITGTGYIGEADAIIEGVDGCLELASNRLGSYASTLALTSTDGTNYNNWAIVNGGSSASGRLRLMYSDIQANTLGNINQEFMSVTTSGNVGIGTTTPGSKLHISNIGDCELRISADSDNSGANEKAIIRFDVDGGGDEWIIQMENLEGPASVLDFIDDSGAKRMILKRNTINMGTLPTSSAGLSSGDIWRNGTVLNIVP